MRGEDHARGGARRRLLRVGIALASLLLAAAVGEVVARFSGATPWYKRDLKISVEPGGTFFRRNSTLGYTHIPGRFTVTLPDGYEFHVTHRDDTLRITHPLETYGDATQRRAQLWIFGCSYTHGWSLDDDETYPWLLQQALPEYEVVNFGVSGYGTIHSLIQMREALATRPPPVLAVLAYAGFHDTRNTFVRLQRKAIAPWVKLGPLVQPYAWRGGNGELEYGFADVEYREAPLMRRSALVHLLELQYNALEERLARSHDVTKALVLEMQALAREHGFALALAGIMGDPATADMLAFAAAHDIATVDIAVDLEQPGMRNLPHDTHPSAAANRVYADRLGAFLRARLSRQRDPSQPASEHESSS